METASDSAERLAAIRERRRCIGGEFLAHVAHDIDWLLTQLVQAWTTNRELHRRTQALESTDLAERKLVATADERIRNYYKMRRKHKERRIAELRRAYRERDEAWRAKRTAEAELAKLREIHHEST